MMTMKELYDLCKAEEEERHKNPCCLNCQNYYIEYGCENCKKHDLPLENVNDKCEDWR